MSTQNKVCLVFFSRNKKNINTFNFFFFLKKCLIWKYNIWNYVFIKFTVIHTLRDLTVKREAPNNNYIQSTLVISNSKGLSETLPDINTSTYKS